MKAKKLLCALLTLALVLPLGLFGARTTVTAASDSAVDKPMLLSVEKLGWKDTTGAYASQGNYHVKSVPGLVGDTALQITGLNSSWSAVQILSPEQMAGVTGAYTLSMKVRIDQMSGGILGFRVGTETTAVDASGDWVIFRYANETNTLENRSYLPEAYKSSTVTVGASYSTLTVEVNPSAQTVKAYLDGSLKSTNTGAHAVTGGIWLMVSSYDGVNLSVYTVDDVKVTAGGYSNHVSATPIYFEDFEAYAPYAERDIFADGTVLYEENFGSVASSSLPARIARSASYNTGGETSALVLGSADDAHLAVEYTGGSGGGWHSYEVAPKNAMLGVRRFTVRYTMTVDYVSAGLSAGGNWTGGAYLRFGAATANGDSNWLYFSSGTHAGELSDYVKMRKFSTSTNFVDLAYKNYASGSLMGKEQKFAVEVDLDAQTASVYLNDFTTPIFTATGIYGYDSGIEVVMKDTTRMTIDDVSVTAGSISDRPATYHGVQESAVSDAGRYSVRFLGTLGDQPLKNYKAVGFHITAVYGSDEVKVFDVPCKNVYSSIIATEGIQATYTAEQLGGKYIFAYTIQNIPTSAGEIVFNVTPYYVTAEGEAEGSRWQVVYNAGVYQGTSLIYPTASSVPTYSGSTSVEVEGGATMMYTASSPKSTYTSYLTSLETAGFEKYDEYSIGENSFATYVSKNLTVTCSYIALVRRNYGEVRIVVDLGSARAPRAQENVYTVENDTLLTQVGLNNLKANNGMSYVLRLADGRFIVFDGGSMDGDDDVKLYNILKSQTKAGEKPVIAAWFLTHGHEDHYGNFLAFAQNFIDKVKIERVVYNLPTTALADTVHNETTQQIDTRIQAIPGAAITYARTGQRFFLADAQIDVLLTPEDFYPTSLTHAEQNEASVIYRVTCQGQTIMILGDTEDRGSEKLSSRYGSYLKSDIMQQAHHGYWAGSETLYNYINPETVLWPSPSHWYYELYDGAHGADSNATIYNSANVKEVILAGNGTRTIQLPYTSATASRPETEVHTYDNGDVIYSDDFEDMTYLYETGWWTVDTNDNGAGGRNDKDVANDGANGLNRGYTRLSLTEMDGDKGVLLTGKGTRSVLGVVRPELLRNTNTYTLDMQLNVISLGSGFSIWYNDEAPVNIDYSSLYSVTKTGKFRLTLEIGRTQTKVYVDGTLVETVVNSSSDMGGLYFYLENEDGLCNVFVGSVQVVASTAEELFRKEYEESKFPKYAESGEGDIGYWVNG